MMDDTEEKTFTDLLDDIYETSENKHEIDAWIPLANLIVQATELRVKKGISQEELAKLMNTRQSVISRFENMGRIPSYEFLSRVALALGQHIGLTLYGDYMGIIPVDKHHLVDEEATRRGVTANEYVQSLVNDAVEKIEGRNRWAREA
jgi:transcriptional regulator with XRE-family HTH domain